MKPEDHNKCVKLGSTLIPAMNVQTDGFPTQDFPVYFEVKFDTGRHWIVTQSLDSTISVEDFLRCEDEKPYMVRSFPQWEEFLVFYKNFFGRNIRL